MSRSYLSLVACCRFDWSSSRLLSNCLLLASAVSFCTFSCLMFLVNSSSFYSCCSTCLLFLSSSWMTYWLLILSLPSSMSTECCRSCAFLLSTSSSFFVRVLSSMVFYLSSFNQAFCVLRFSICCKFNSCFFSKVSIRF